MDALARPLITGRPRPIYRRLRNPEAARPIGRLLVLAGRKVDIEHIEHAVSCHEFSTPRGHGRSSQDAQREREECKPGQDQRDPRSENKAGDVRPGECPLWR